MPNTQNARHVMQVTKTFAEGSLVTVVVIVSAITVATLVFAWFFA